MRNFFKEIISKVKNVFKRTEEEPINGLSSTLEKQTEEENEHLTNSINLNISNEVLKNFSDDYAFAKYYRENVLFSGPGEENNIKLLSEAKSKYDIRNNKIEDSSYLHNNNKFFPENKNIESSVELQPSQESSSSFNLLNSYQKGYLKPNSELQSPVVLPPTSENIKEGKELVVLPSQESSSSFNLLNFYQKGYLKPNSESQLPILLSKKASDLKGNFNTKEYIEELTAGVQGIDGKSDFWKNAAIRNAKIKAKVYNKNPTDEGLKELQEIIDNPNLIKPGVMDYVATNPNAVKGVAGGAGLIALTNFLMSDRKGQMTNEELYSQ